MDCLDGGIPTALSKLTMAEPLRRLRCHRHETRESVLDGTMSPQTCSRRCQLEDPVRIPKQPIPITLSSPIRPIPIQHTIHHDDEVTAPAPAPAPAPGCGRDSAFGTA